MNQAPLLASIQTESDMYSMVFNFINSRNTYVLVIIDQKDLEWSLMLVSSFAFESIQVLEAAAFQKQMLEKLIWISAFMLVGARHPGATVGVVEKDYRSEASFFLPFWKS